MLVCLPVFLPGLYTIDHISISLTLVTPSCRPTLSRSRRETMENRAVWVWTADV